jgi:ketosteroid isomerase-like protein
MIGMGATRADIITWSAEFAQGRKLVAIEFTCDEFYVNGDVAVVFSNYRVQHELSGQQFVDAGRAIELFERRGGRWVNPSWHLDEAE